MNNIFFVLLLYCFCLFTPTETWSQYENVWAFGANAGVDFNYDPPRAIQTSLNTNEGSAIICNEEGELLFYNDGTIVWDKNHDPMPNGLDLPRLGTNVTASTTQGALVIPIPGNAFQYYVFSLGCWECGGHRGKLFYSIVDMRLNNGLGDVVATKKGILLDIGLTEQMSAVSGNNCDIWFITSQRSNSDFKAYNITANGIDSNFVLSFGVPPFPPIGFDNIASLDISPDRKKIASTRGRMVIVYDFDASSGVITNPLILDTSDSHYGVAFSPDGTKLYAGFSLMQFDLSLGSDSAIKASKTYISSSSSDLHGAIKRASNGKVYCSNYLGTNLHIIHHPNLAGIACQYEENGFSLFPGSSAMLGLPNLATIVKNTRYFTSSLDSFCQGSFAVLKPREPSGINHVWNDSISGSNLEVNTPGTYWVSYQMIASSCIEQVDTFHVTMHPFSAKLAITPSCASSNNGAAVHVVEEGNISYEYRWQQENDTTVLSTDSVLQHVGSGDYRVAISSLEGCDTILYFHIPEEDYEVSFNPDTVICEGDGVFFRNQSDTHFESWYWSFGDEHTSTERSPSHIFTDSGTYEVTLTGIGKICTDTAYRTVRVDAPVEDLYFSADPTTICQGETIDFIPYTKGNPLQLHWSFGDQTDMYSSLESVQHAYEHTGTIYITLTASFRACPDVIYTDSIIVHELPKVDLGPDSVLCAQGRPITLYNYYSSATGDRYLWSTGATTESIQVLHHGVYNLTVTSPYGCSTKEQVRIAKDCYTDIPNAFTPNGDGLNDYFFPRQYLTSGAISFRFQVFNRWGQQVFETQEKDGRGWDGRFNDKEQPVGVYIYKMEVEYNNNRRELYEGNVTLVK